MADDSGRTPTPRPRRRRTDIDPNAPSPPVANDRRRKRPAAGATSSPPVVAAAAAAALVPPIADADPPPDATAPFRVPGLAAAAAVGAATDAEEAASQPETAADVRPSWLQVLDDRSPDPNVCPFLRATGENGLVAPIEKPDPANRCAALAEAVPQSRRQQELVCLTTGHVNCPRYLRGAAVMTETPAPTIREGRAMSPAMIGSLVVLVMALTASVAFVLARGGTLTLSPSGPSASASPPLAAVVSPTTAPSTRPSVSPSLSVAATATPTPTSTPTPTAVPTPTPRSDRYELLRACSGTSNCWIYRVRPGDNLFSIARYFGVSQNSIYARNPWLRERGLRAGQELRLPPPTR